MYDPSSPLLRPANGKGALPTPVAKSQFAEDRLLDAVIHCEILPGETITEADVMGRFGLTRAAARAGLTRLGYDNWAVPQARTGWLVQPITGALIGQVLDARRIAEPSLAEVRLSAEAKDELRQTERIIKSLRSRNEPGAIASYRQYVDRVDGILLASINPFTARHLRKLWHHTARITEFLEDKQPENRFRRDDIEALVSAVLAVDDEGVAAARLSLIDQQEAFFLRRLLKSEAPLVPGSTTSGGSSMQRLPATGE